MDHNEAITILAVERYLLNELTPEVRDAFEEHLFDCTQCAADLRAGAAFVREARVQLPLLDASTPAAGTTIPGARLSARKKNWFFSLQAAFAVPVFATLVGIIGYQNLATIPSLRSRADEPRLLPWASIHAGTRGGEATVLLMSRTSGGVVLIDLLEDSRYTSYSFDLLNPKGEQIWTKNEEATNSSIVGGGTYSLLIPGYGLQQGKYSLVITGVGAEGGRTEIDRRTLELHFQD